MGQVVPARAKLSQQQMVAIERLRFCLAFAKLRQAVCRLNRPRSVWSIVGLATEYNPVFLSIVVYVIPNKNMNVSSLVLIAVQKIVL